MTRSSRSSKGNMLALATIVTCCILVPLFLLQSQIGLFVVDQSRIDSVVDGASLVAANEISKIVINDDHFGYVSLSNYPPVGKFTIAPDGEPLPAVGINTLVGTIRQNTIVAHELNNLTMQNLAEKDRLYLNSTIKNLNFALQDSLKAKKKQTWNDIYGNEIDPRKSALEFVKSNLPENMELVSIRVSSGWLKKGGGTTTVEIPSPERLSYTKEEHVQGKEYKPFMDIPAFGKRFTFAGLSKSSRLVASGRFRRADKSHINSIVKVECVVKRKDLHTGGLSLKNKQRYVSCSQPYSMPDAGPKGVLTMRYTGGPAAGLTTWQDLINESTFADRKVTTYRSMGGDYPLDREARMLKSSRLANLNTAQQFSQNLYCWYRNGLLRPDIDSIQAMMNEYIKLNPNEIRVYEFSDDGSISRRSLPKYPFPIGVTSDAQISVVADTRIQGGISPVIIFRNNVRYLGTKYGGKHCGQPLPGLKLNWCELDEYGGDRQIALGLGKGSLKNHMAIASNASGNSFFNLLNGNRAPHQPRKTYFSGGLAVDIEIGGTARASSNRDVISMRKLPR